MYWYLAESEGFDPDLFDGSGGNNTALALVTEGHVLQGCNPSFLDGRDGIVTETIEADGALPPQS